ncbi:mutagen-sensitive 101 isoform X2 [Choristoneura fumiferana]|uniref:mutagen-sensitive 101 isoform X2 n=1 Tax=Choristoneura fumiferana TaxID=7141 RepID=UPI003D15D409
MSEDIQVTFVIPQHCNNQTDCSEEMLIAYTACENHQGGGLQARWIHESELKLDNDVLSMKKHVYVLSEFKGELYEQLKSTNCQLVGPRCLSCCFTEGNPIPSRGHPIYTVAMRGLVVTASGLPKNSKAQIQQKIEWMGGTYSPVLTDATTHLISNNVLSDKYIKSTERGIPVMRETWVEAVWKASLKLDINGSSSEFDSHRLPPFANLQITTSGLSVVEKKLIMKLVNANGGEFSRVFQSETTDVLVLSRDNIGSEKCKAAVEYGKVCVTPHWIKDSAALGFAAPVARYKICTASTSSPITENRLPDMSLNFSRITKVERPRNFIDETGATDNHALSGSTKIHQESKTDTTSYPDEIQKEFEKFDMTNIKKAGPIFDGFCIWVTGLEGVARERAAACVSRGGGVRYDAPHARVTHAAAAPAAAAAAAAALPAVPVLSPLWLLRSIEAGRVLDETEFLINAPPATPVKSQARAVADTASPMSKRNLQLLRTAPAAPPPPPGFDAHEDPIVNHYLSQNLPNTSSIVAKSLEPVQEKKTTEVNEHTVITQSDYTIVDNIFKDIVFEVQGLEEDAICEIGAEIREAGGVMAAAGAGGSHALVPLDFDTQNLVTKDAEAVTVFWVKDCLSQQALVRIEYYHRPVKLAVAGAAPLRGVVASLSTYTGVERAFLDEVAKLLGATTQQRFCRRTTASALASTHLICPEASGAKYGGALKWGVPAVRAAWLLACAAAGARVPEPEYSVDNQITHSEVDSTTVNIQSNHDNTGQSSKTEYKPHDDVQESDLPNSSYNQPDPVLPQPETTVEARSSPPKAIEEMLPPAITRPRPPASVMNNHPQKNKKRSKTQFEGLSPATRFITMFRMGMFNSDHEDSSKENSIKEDSPKEESEESFQEPEPERTIETPPLDEVLLTPNLRGLSPSTRRRLQAVKRGEMLSDPIRTPMNPFEKKTPHSTIGGDLRPGSKRLSVDARKRLWGFVNDLPSASDQRNNDDTPLSDLCGQFLAQFDKKSAEQNVARRLELEEPANTPPPKIAKLTENQCAGGASILESECDSGGHEGSASSTLPAEVDVQLQRLSVVLTGRRAPPPGTARARTSSARPDMEYEPGAESQPNTVGWDDITPSQKDLVGSVQISKPKRMQTAPAEMVSSHPATKLPDMKQNLPATVPLKEEVNDLKTQLNHEAPPVVTVDREIVPDCDRDQNASVTNRFSFSNGNKADIPKHNVPDETVLLENKRTSVPNEEKPHDPSRMPCLVKRFMLSSNVDNHEETVEMILRLGGEVTDLAEAEAEAGADTGDAVPATHLLCTAPARSQRILSSIAAGCWVLHPAYIARSASAGTFLPEEGFEWGNPVAECLPCVGAGERELAAAAHRWRTRRARGLPGPFAGVVALLHVSAARRLLLARFILAGGGRVTDEQPPYSDESITVCFTDPKRYPMKQRDKEWLVSRRVPACAPILLSAFLTESTRPDLLQHCLPEFRPSD